ncbi:MAG: hypothetical protein Q8O57_05995, partial [Kiritimatiellota bacterium]|nr:hypothetical protein [Kiritimatiellota bacterium]
LAGYEDGSEESGEFGDNRSISLYKKEHQPRWFALYDPSLKIGILQFSPQQIPGGTLIQVRPNYHKHYTSLSGIKFKQGDRVAYSMCVRVLEDETGDWSATRRAVEHLGGVGASDRKDNDK